MTSAQPKPTSEILTPKELFDREDFNGIGAIYYGLYDRIYEWGHAYSHIVRAPVNEDGATDWANAHPINLEKPDSDSGPADMAEARRMAVLIDDIDACDTSTSLLLWLDAQSGQPMLAQVSGPQPDGPIAKRIIGRDIGAEPPADDGEPSLLQQELAKLTDKLFEPKPKPAPAAANDNRIDQKYGKFTITRFRDLGQAKPKPFIVKGVRYAGESSYTVAKPGGGKSVAETDISYHIATGRDWHGHRVEQGLVVYLAAERKALQERRVEAYRKHFGDEGRDIPLVILGGMPDFTDIHLRDAQNMMLIIEALEKEYSLPCRLITIDTLARAFGGKDQNATKDMSAYVYNIARLMEKFPAAHISSIHHEGWETGRAKGSIDLDGAVDASFRITKNGEGVDAVYKLICDGANDGGEGTVLTFGMLSIEIAVDEDGEPITAPVVVPAVDAVEGFVQATETKQATAEADAMAMFLELSADGRDPVGGGMWLARFKEAEPTTNERTLQSRWQRAVKALEKAGRVASSGSPKVYTLTEMQE